MLKKVKQKSYKSKRDFADDLNLIWDNCFKYNVGVVSRNIVESSFLRNSTLPGSSSPTRGVSLTK